MGDDDSLREHPVLGVETEGTAVVVRLGGELDLYNVDEIRAALAGAADRGLSRVVVDLEAVEFVDSTVLGVLVEAHKALPGNALMLAAPQLEVRRALLVSGLDRRLNVHDTVNDALTS